MAARRELILTAALMHGLGAEHGAWRVRAGAASDYVSPAYYTDMAQAAERGKLQALFLAEQMTNRDTGTDRPCGAMDTVTVLSFMAAATSRLGLVGTGSTTYNQPYDLARRFSTLDQLAQGRIGWNSVTTANASTARMFGGSGIDEHPDALDRYARADEFLEVVTELWASWDDGALVGDKASGVFADPARIHEIGYRGKFFDVLGPAPFPRRPRGARSSSTPGPPRPAATRRPAAPTWSSPLSTPRRGRPSSATTSAGVPPPTAVTPNWSRSCPGSR